MSEFKGTKGKWKLHGSPYMNNSEISFQSVSSSVDNNILICNAYGVNLEKAKSNAKLIACAPEMLEMLQKCNELLLRVQSPATACLFMSQNIKQIIKKATE